MSEWSVPRERALRVLLKSSDHAGFLTASDWTCLLIATSTKSTLARQTDKVNQACLLAFRNEWKRVMPPSTMIPTPLSGESGRHLWFYFNRIDQMNQKREHAQQIDQRRLMGILGYHYVFSDKERTLAMLNHKELTDLQRATLVRLIEDFSRMLKDLTDGAIGSEAEMELSKAHPLIEEMHIQVAKVRGHQQNILMERRVRQYLSLSDSKSGYGTQMSRTIIVSDLIAEDGAAGEIGSIRHAQQRALLQRLLSMAELHTLLTYSSKSVSMLSDVYGCGLAMLRPMMKDGGTCALCSDHCTERTVWSSVADCVSLSVEKMYMSTYVCKQEESVQDVFVALQTLQSAEDRIKQLRESSMDSAAVSDATISEDPLESCSLDALIDGFTLCTLRVALARLLALTGQMVGSHVMSGTDFSQCTVELGVSLSHSRDHFILGEELLSQSQSDLEIINADLARISSIPDGWTSLDECVQKSVVQSLRAKQLGKQSEQLQLEVLASLSELWYCKASVIPDRSVISELVEKSVDLMMEAVRRDRKLSGGDRLLITARMQKDLGKILNYRARVGRFITRLSTSDLEQLQRDKEAAFESARHILEQYYLESDPPFVNLLRLQR